jgi:thiol:disulfide interchange protein DsbG
MTDTPMNLRMTRTNLSRAAAAALVLCAAASAALAQEPPAALRALESQGLKVVGTFPAPGGLTAWAAYSGKQPVAFYATPDGKHVIAGSMFDAEGRNLTREALDKAVRVPMSAVMWKQLEASNWIADGQAKAPRTVYVFTDPNCPYCNKFWSDARPWVDSGKVVLRHIMVGILTPTSAGKAAALLADKNPSAALLAHERGHAAENAKVLASGRPKPLGDSGVKPLDKIPPAVQARLDANEKLMADWGLQATPSVAWRDAAGIVQMRTGAPDETLPEIFGAR